MIDEVARCHVHKRQQQLLNPLTLFRATYLCRSATPTLLSSTLPGLSFALALASTSCSRSLQSYVLRAPRFPLLRLIVNQKVLARVGLRRNASGDFANGANGMQLNPASSSRISTLPHYSAPNAAVNDYLVGTQLDEALAAGQDILISWPFADGDVRDWTQAEAIWYVVFYYADHPCQHHFVLGNT